MEDRIKTARELAAEIELLPGVKSARVDDWDRGAHSFSLFVTLDLDEFLRPRQESFSMLKLTNSIRRIFGGRSYSIHPPKRMYEQLGYPAGGKRYPTRFVGYEKKEIEIDLNIY